MDGRRKEKEAFRGFLRSREMRLTPEREKILDEAFSLHDHFEAEDLLLRIRQRGFRVSRATIYRTLALLVQAGVIREVIFGERHSHYEHVLGHGRHDHLICRSCGRIIEFTDETIERIQQKICDEHGFVPERHKFEITGYCVECKAQNARSKAE